MECQICYNKYTSKLRRKYTCIECFESTCTVCVMKHMMNNFDDFNCMFCGTHILITDLREYLSAAKYKKLADKEIEHLFQIEIGMLNETKTALDEEQRLIEMDVIINWMRRDGLSDAQIFHELNNMGYLKKRYKHITLTHRCPNCNDLLNHEKNENEKSDDEPYTCDSCNIQICSLCIEQKQTNHQCDQDVLETLKHIHATCETCPKCHTVIEKESGGCDQMFCTKCNTTFSWTTRRILTKGEVRHNPHFYEWQRQQKEGIRNPLDNPCEGHFLIKCENLNNVTILPESLATTIHKYDKLNMSVEKGVYLKFVQSMLSHSVETIMGIQERDGLIRQQFRARYLTKCLNFKYWKIRFKQHINTLRRNNETKMLLLACLDSLYYIVLAADADTSMIEHLFTFITTNLKKVQDHYGRTINYKISTENVVLPYMI